MVEKEHNTCIYYILIKKSCLYFDKKMCIPQSPLQCYYLKEYMSDCFTNYNYVGNTKVSVSID